MRKNILEGIESIKKLIFKPGLYFRGVENNEKLRTIGKGEIKILAVMIVIFLVLHSIGDFINAQVDRNIKVNLTEEARKTIASTFSEPAKGSLVKSILLARMSYLLFWTLLFGFSVACRNWILKLFALKNIYPFKVVAAISLLGFIPLMFITGIMTFINQIFPMSPYLISNNSIYFRVFIAFAAGVMALYFEKRIINESLMLDNKLARGVTSLIWFSPYIFIYIVFSAAILLVRIF